MGLYLSVSAIHSDERGEEVYDLIFRALGGRGHRRLPKSMAARETGQNQVMISTESLEWLTVVYPQGFGDGYGCTQALSETFDCHAFNFEIYDDTWWYNFFFEGELLDVFWQHPRKFHGEHEDVTDEMISMRRGRPAVVTEAFFGVPETLLVPYYRQIDDGEFYESKASDPEGYAAALETAREALGGKADPSDAYQRSDPWVFTDFAAKLGVVYPTDRRTHENLRFFAVRADGSEPLAAK